MLVNCQCQQYNSIILCHGVPIQCTTKLCKEVANNFETNRIQVQKINTGYASSAQGASPVRKQLIADARSSVVPFLNSSINFCYTSNHKTCNH